MTITEFGSLLASIANIIVDFFWSPPVSYFVGLALIGAVVIIFKKIIS